MVVEQPQSTRVEEPTLLCNQVPEARPDDPKSHDFTGWKVLSSIALRIQRIRVIALNSANKVAPFASSIEIGKRYVWP